MKWILTVSDKDWTLKPQIGSDMQPPPENFGKKNLVVCIKDKCFLLNTTYSRAAVAAPKFSFFESSDWIWRVYSSGLNGNCEVWKGDLHSLLYRGDSLSARLALHQNNQAFACQPGWLWEEMPGIWFISDAAWMQKQESGKCGERDIVPNTKNTTKNRKAAEI